MRIVLVILLVLAALATLFVLIRGVVTMAGGKDVTGQRSQELMRKRVLFQAIAIFIAVLLLLVASGGRLSRLVKLNKIYTRTGDAGETGLVDGSRVSKADPRMAAIGDVDEANCAIGVALLAVDGDGGARDAGAHPERAVRSRRRSRHAGGDRGRRCASCPSRSSGWSARSTG